jgi:hypothetical protein
MSTLRKNEITDNEVARILTLREMKKVLSKKLDKVDKDLKGAENDVIQLMEGGAEIDTSYNIAINETSKTYPKYKEELEKRLGINIVDEIIKTTQPRIFKKLVIGE